MGSFATSIALVLSMNNVVGSVMLTRNSSSRPRIATAWHAASELETISASKEESATVFCLRVDQATAAPQYRKTWPEGGLVSAASAEATATEQSEFAEMKTLMKSTEVN